MSAACGSTLTLSAGLGGGIVGCFPTFNTYVLEFSTLDRIDELESLKAQIEADPNVLFAARSARVKTSSLVKHIDTRDRASLFNGRTSSAAGQCGQPPILTNSMS